jgi:hypothetical protein
MHSIIIIYYNSKAIASNSSSISNLLSRVNSLKAQISFSNKTRQEWEICLLMGACQTHMGGLNRQ